MDEIAQKLFNPLEQESFAVENIAVDFYQNSRVLKVAIDEKCQNGSKALSINNYIIKKVSKLFRDGLDDAKTRKGIIDAFEVCPEDLGNILGFEMVEKVKKIKAKGKTSSTALAETFPSNKMTGSYALLGMVVATSIVAAKGDERRNPAISSAVILTGALALNFFRNLYNWHQ